MIGLATLLIALAIGFVGVVVFLSLKYPTIRDDLVWLKRMFHIAVSCISYIIKKRTILDVFEKWVLTQPNKPCILFGDDTLTYIKVDEQANKLAHFLRDGKLLKLKDVACIFMYNEPAYVYSWLAFSKLGAVSSLINVNLRGRCLLHCITASKAAIVMCGKDPALINAISEILVDLQDQEIKVIVYDTEDKNLPSGMISIEPYLRSASVQNLPSEFRNHIRQSVKPANSAVYIFTSGTTGLPKPARMSYRRLMIACYILHLFDIDASDVVYIPLPFYHGAGFCIGLMNVLRVGATAAVRPKFSATHFWIDVRKYQATIIQYIGETCRYLLAQPKRDDDGQFPVPIKLAVGNGLRSDKWLEFMNRFNIKRIGELYGATEANFLVVNLDGKVGAVGRYTPFVKLLAGNIEILKCDITTAEPERGPDGLCVPQPNGTTGLMALKVSKVSPLDGYVASKKVNEAKLIYNVRRHGDCYFNTGDLLMIDEEFYIYFKDRIGDTFRWKGENVSTTEVALVVDDYQEIEESTVYGVEVPGCEGRCGMAAVVLKSEQTKIDGQKVYDHMTNYLPVYACPKFLRITDTIAVTGTFKHTKVGLIKEGFDPSQISDVLYFMDIPKKTYSQLNTAVYQDIVDGKVRL